MDSKLKGKLYSIVLFDEPIECIAEEPRKIVITKELYRIGKVHIVHAELQPKEDDDDQKIL